MGTRESMVRAAEQTLSAVFTPAEVVGGHAHRFRHTLATEPLASSSTSNRRGVKVRGFSDVLGVLATLREILRAAH